MCLSNDKDDSLRLHVYMNYSVSGVIHGSSRVFPQRPPQIAAEEDEECSLHPSHSMHFIPQTFCCLHKQFSFTNQIDLLHLRWTEKKMHSLLLLFEHFIHLIHLIEKHGQNFILSKHKQQSQLAHCKYYCNNRRDIKTAETGYLHRGSLCRGDEAPREVSLRGVYC